MYTTYGYQVVPQPAVVQTVVQPTIVQTAPQPAVVTASSSSAAQQQAAPNATVENAASTAATQDAFTVNIPNSKGTYTPVTLKKSGNGFIGPQGEYYPQFPSIEQLKVMYAK